MIRVCIWDNNELTGHAALGVGRYYRSFHAREKQLSLLNPLENFACLWVKDPDDDWQLQEKLVETIDLDGLSVADMESYIADTRKGLEYDYDSYNLYFQNCSTVVAHLLLVGYYHHLPKHGSLKEILWKLRSGHMLFSTEITPHNSRAYETAFDKFEQDAAIMLRKQLLTRFWFVGGLIEVFRRGIIWTPGDVSRMAHTLKKHIRNHG